MKTVRRALLSLTVTLCMALLMWVSESMLDRDRVPVNLHALTVLQFVMFFQVFGQVCSVALQHSDF